MSNSFRNNSNKNNTNNMTKDTACKTIYDSHFYSPHPHLHPPTPTPTPTPTYSPNDFPTKKCLNVLADLNVHGSANYKSNNIENVTTLEVQIITSKEENNASKDILLIPEGNTIVASLSGKTYVCGEMHISGDIDMHKSNIKNVTCVSSRKICCDLIETGNCSIPVVFRSDIIPNRSCYSLGTKQSIWENVFANNITIHGTIYNEHGDNLMESIDMHITKQIGQFESDIEQELKPFVNGIVQEELQSVIESINITNKTTNVSLGTNALKRCNDNTTYNTCIGHNSLDIVSGNQNVAIGCGAMGQTSTLNSRSNEISYNIAIGTNTLSESHGCGCIAIGHESLSENILGNQNVAIGYQSLQFNTNVGGLVAIGTNALKNNKQGKRNTAIGHHSLILNYSGTNNTALGYHSGNISLTSNNTFLGANANKSSPFFHDVCAIGYGAIAQGDGFVQLGQNKRIREVTAENITSNASVVVKQNAELHFRTQMIATEEWVDNLTKLASIDGNGNFVKGGVFNTSCPEDWNDEPPTTVEEAINRIAKVLRKNNLL